MNHKNYLGNYINNSIRLVYYKTKSTLIDTEYKTGVVVVSSLLYKKQIINLIYS